MMVAEQILYSRDWENSVILSIQFSDFETLKKERELLVKEQVNLVYDCEIENKDIVETSDNIFTEMLQPDKAKKLFSKRAFLINANDYNHQFLKLNEEYELKKVELDRKSEILKNITG